MVMFRRFIISSLMLVPLAALQAQNNYITPYTFTTFAGIAKSSGTEDGAIDVARFGFLEGVAVDNAGNVNVADTFNSTIRKITTNPTTGTATAVTTLAGMARSLGSTDGTGSEARFAHPHYLTTDSSGNVYVPNGALRKITPAAVVTTLVGAAGIGPNDGDANTARFFNPGGMAADTAGNLYVADRENHTIRKITINAGTGAVTVTTLAGVAGSPGSADGPGAGAPPRAMRS